MDVSAYCREVETYLCRKNEGHLVRIVGPVFEMVSGWAAQGVPLAVALKGIDDYCERYYAKGPRRRPVRVEFCEADVLTRFDDWRRAVGVSPAGGQAETPEKKADSLPSHIDRAIARLTALRASPSLQRGAAFTDGIDAVVRELDRLKASAKQARGEGRKAILDRLAGLDADLAGLARASVDADMHRDLTSRAGEEIAPFAARMTPDARAAALDAAYARLAREAAGLPVLTLV